MRNYRHDELKSKKRWKNRDGGSWNNLNKSIHVRSRGRKFSRHVYDEKNVVKRKL